MADHDSIDILIGIDDTDNAESRGTGYHSRQLAHLLENFENTIVKGITRHQLYVHPMIRYTSQNSSACIAVQTNNVQDITTSCEKYLIKNSALGSDAGLCITPENKVGPSVIDWGYNAKKKILKMEDAFQLSMKGSFYLKGFTGTHEGIIGALAAVGLRSGGNDGRFIWRKGRKELREVQEGIITSNELIDELELDQIMSLEGDQPATDERIYINDWVRPILKDNKSILIAEKTDNHDEFEWKLTSKEIIRTIS